MSGTLMPRWLGMVGRRVLLRLLAVGRDVGPMLDDRNVQPGAGVSFIATYHHHDRFDAVAGCEYVDDRIRFRE